MKTLYILTLLHTAYSVLHERSNKTGSFAEHLKLQEKMTFRHILWVNTEKSKENNRNQDTLHFEITTYRVLHERINKTASFAEHLKFQDKLTFTYVLSVKSGKLK